MDYENVQPVQDIGAWYNLFSGNNTAEEPKEVKPSTTNALGELLIYAAQASAYANFINSAMNTIEQDIKSDIMRDAAPAPVVPISGAGAAVPTMATTIPTIQPLAMAVANREKLVEYSEKLAAVIKSIDSILARVKIKEEQNVGV